LVRRLVDGLARYMFHTINDAKRCAFWRLRLQLHEPGLERPYLQLSGRLKNNGDGHDQWWRYPVCYN
jgi:hypothetical protein